VKKEPAWLTLQAVLAMHEQLVAEHGGDAGVRNLGLLDSALAGPGHHHTYGERDIFVLAATYAHGITRNHPFIDGNKRTAFLAAYTFLGLNGWDLNAPEEQVVQMVVGLSDRSVSAEAFAEWLRGSIHPIQNARAPKKKGTDKH
jgi:death-on-curing protein